MTEQTLERANEIKHEIDNARKIYKELEEAQKLCWGNTGEVRARKFCIQVQEGDTYKKTVRITPEAAKTALDEVMKEIKEEIDGLKSQLEELH